MDEEDRAAFDAECMRAFGEKVDRDLDIGSANGFTPAQQEEIVRALFRAFKSR